MAYRVETITSRFTGNDRWSGFFVFGGGDAKGYESLCPPEAGAKRDCAAQVEVW